MALAQKRLYDTFRNMRHRCFNPKDSHYASYGGRGITVCPEWSQYKAFHDWSLSHGYGDNLTIERIDNNMGYSPDNCRWIPRPAQARNKRNNRFLTAFGETKLLIEWAEDPRCLVSGAIIFTRIYAGWDAEKAIITPLRETVKPQGRMVTFRGETLSVYVWAKRLNMHPPTLYNRLRRGLTGDALFDQSETSAPFTSHLVKHSD